MAGSRDNVTAGREVFGGAQVAAVECPVDRLRSVDVLVCLARSDVVVLLCSLEWCVRS